jgi:uncharacterized protein with LGFP repeats
MSKNKDSRRLDRKQNQALGSIISKQDGEATISSRGVEEYDKKKSQLSIWQRKSKQEAEATPETAENPRDPEFVNF